MLHGFIAADIIFDNAQKFSDLTAQCFFCPFGIFSSLFQHFFTSWHRNMFRNLLLFLCPSHGVRGVCVYWSTANDISTSRHPSIHICICICDIISSYECFWFQLRTSRIIYDSGKKKRTKQNDICLFAWEGMPFRAASVYISLDTCDAWAHQGKIRKWVFHRWMQC